MPGKRERRQGGSQVKTLVRRSLTLHLFVLGVVFSLIVFEGVYAGMESQVMAGVKRQAESYVDLIVTARQWNASHGGVWVSKELGAKSNPYLRGLGVVPDIRTETGEVLTLRNPALMTREISELLVDRNGLSFRLTSLSPVNPDNAPDDWETASLREFTDDDDAPRDAVVKTDAGRVYRYIVPLRIDQRCLTCHKVRGEEIGDLRGAISVSIPLQTLDEQRLPDAIRLGLIVLVGGVVFLGVVEISTRRMTRQLEMFEHDLARLATTDSLTGLWNRRHILERFAEEHERAARSGRPYGILVADIDHFKAVNDTHGHARGDEVLRAVAERLKDTVRGYDLIGRIGGEEFIAIVPDADPATLLAIAERARERVGDAPVRTADADIEVSISVGAAVARAGETPEDVTARADAAMYRSKNDGRNRVTMA